MATTKRTQSVTINREFMKSIAVQIAAAVQDVAKKNGVLISPAGGSYEEGVSGTQKLLIVAVPTAAGAGTKSTVPVTARSVALATKYNEDCLLYGCQRKWLNKTFISGNSGKQFTLVGMVAGRSKFKLIGARVPDGKQFKFTVDIVKAAFAA